MVTFQEKYLTVAEMAAHWGVQVRVVQEWCRTGRIPGATRMGRSWLIPADSERPEDRRLREASQPNQPNQPALPTFSVLAPSSTMDCTGMDDESLAGLLSDSEHRLLLQADLAKFRGDFTGSLQLAGRIPATSPYFAGALFCQFLAAASLGRCDQAQAAHQRLKELRDNPTLSDGSRHRVELALIIISTKIHDLKGFPQWFTEGDFTKLPAACRPLAVYAHIRYLYGQCQYERMLGCAQTALAFLHGSGTGTEIYLALLTASALAFLNRSDQAYASVELMARLAVPRGLLAPFAGCICLTGGVIERVFSQNWPKLCRDLREMHAALWSGWIRTHNALLRRSVTLELNHLEWHVALQMAQGYSNQEIATRLGLSLSAVKRRVQTVLAKLEVRSRRAVAPHVRWIRP